jgi:hypothetical protein
MVRVLGLGRLGVLFALLVALSGLVRGRMRGLQPVHHHSARERAEKEGAPNQDHTDHAEPVEDGTHHVTHYQR